MKQNEPDVTLKANQLSSDEIKDLLEYLDTGNPNDDEDDLEEIDPFSGIPIDNKRGYEPYRAPRQIAIRKCSKCHCTFDSFVGIESSICNKCREKLGYPLIPEADDMVDGRGKRKNKSWSKGTPTSKGTHAKSITRKAHEVKETYSTISSQSNFTDDELLSMLSHVGKRKH